MGIRGRPEKLKYFFLKDFKLLEDFLTYIYFKSKKTGKIFCPKCKSDNLKGALVTTGQVGRFIIWRCMDCKHRWNDWLTDDDKNDHYLLRRLRKKEATNHIETKIPQFKHNKKNLDKDDFVHTIY